MMNIDEMSSFFEEESKIDYKKELNQEQLESVNALNGPVLIIAGAGTGKTKSLTYRLAHMIESGIDPATILLLTFTNKAADEMRERAMSLIGPKCEKITSGTYHSFCAKVLRRYAKVLGFKNNFNIIDDADSVEAINIVKEKHRIKGDKDDKEYPKSKDCYTIFDKAVNYNISVEKAIERFFPWFEPYMDDILFTKTCFDQYKKDTSVMNYGDLLYNMVELLKIDSIQKKISSTYQYIMVDEYQDTNDIQAAILKYLCKGTQNNLCVVGDDDQAIYSFRGANYHNILNFEKEFDGCKKIILNRNYRSNQEILDFSNRVTDNISKQIKKELVGTHKKGLKPELICVNNQMTEANVVFYNIMQEYKAGTPFSDMAVLVRNSYSSSELETLITTSKRKFSIPYQKFGGVKFLEKQSTRNVLAFVRICANNRDEISWFRILKILPGIGHTYANMITEDIMKNGVNALLNKKYEKRNFKPGLDLLFAELQKLEDKPFYDQLDYIIRKMYKKLVMYAISMKKISKLEKENEERNLHDDIESMTVLIDFAKGYDSISSFLDDLSTGSLSDDDSDDKLTISTVHSAKGLEWKTVYILDCVDGVFPSSKSLNCADEDLQDALDEECKVLYVAITRAKENLYIMKPDYIKTYDGYQRTELSRYLRKDELYKDLMFVQRVDNEKGNQN